MQQAKRPRIEPRNPNTYFLGIGRFAPKAANGARSLSPSAPQSQLRALTFTALIDLLW